MAAPTTTVVSSTDSGTSESAFARQAEAEVQAKLRRLLLAVEEAHLLDLLIGLVEQRAQVGTVLVDLLNGEDNRAGIRNLEGQLMLLASVSPDIVAPIVDGMAAGARRASEAMQAKDADRPLGVGGVWHALHEPDVNLGMRAMIGFFGGFGSAWRAAAEERRSFTQPVSGAPMPASMHTPGPGRRESQ